MNKGTLLILASARKQSDTRKFLDKVFLDIDHTLVDLLEHPVSPYDYSANYPDNDEFLKIAEQMLLHDVIVFATPVYWYAMSGLMKTFFDRFTDLVTINKKSGRQLKGKSTFLLAVGAEEELPDGFENPFKQTSDYLHMDYQGCIYYSIRFIRPENELLENIHSFTDKIKKQNR